LIDDSKNDLVQVVSTFSHTHKPKFIYHRQL